MHYLRITDGIVITGSIIISIVWKGNKVQQCKSQKANNGSNWKEYLKGSTSGLNQIYLSNAWGCWYDNKSDEDRDW